MYPECRHVTPSGTKCATALVRDSHFCYFHRNLNERMYAVPPPPGTPFRLPSIEDARGIQIAIMEVMWAMGQKRIPQKEAGTYLYGINIASRFVPRPRSVNRKAVRELCYDNNGMEMAPAVDACEPPHDCLPCNKRSTCWKFELYKDDVEDLEDLLAEEEEQKKLQAQGSQPPAGQSAQNPDQQSAAAQPDKGKYDHELPHVRALFEWMEVKAEARQKAEQEAKASKEAEKQAVIKVEKQAQQQAAPTADPQAAVTKQPQAGLTAEPEALVTEKPQPSVMKEQEASITTEQQNKIPAGKEPVPDPFSPIQPEVSQALS